MSDVDRELRKQWQENQKAWEEVAKAFRKLETYPEYKVFVDRLNHLTALKGEELLNLSDDLGDVARMLVLKGTVRGLQLAAGLVPVILAASTAPARGEEDTNAR